MRQGVCRRGGHILAKDAGIRASVASTVAPIAEDTRREVLLRGVFGQILGDTNQTIISIYENRIQGMQSTHPAS